MITRHVKEYSVSSISVHFWRKKCCLLRKFARFACFITYKRVVKGFRQLSVKPCSVLKFPKKVEPSCDICAVNTSWFFLVTQADNNASSDDSVFEKLSFRATTLKRIDTFSNVSGFRSVFKCLRFRKRRPPFSIVAVWSRGENA